MVLRCTLQSHLHVFKPCPFCFSLTAKSQHVFVANFLREFALLITSFLKVTHQQPLLQANGYSSLGARSPPSGHPQHAQAPQEPQPPASAFQQANGHMHAVQAPTDHGSGFSSGHSSGDLAQIPSPPPSQVYSIGANEQASTCTSVKPLLQHQFSSVWSKRPSKDPPKISQAA